MDTEKAADLLRRGRQRLSDGLADAAQAMEELGYEAAAADLLVQKTRLVEFVDMGLRACRDRDQTSTVS